MKKTKIISVFASFAMLISAIPVFGVTFPDVEDSSQYAKAIETLTALGVVDGDDNGLFNPKNPVTRAEFTKLLVEALGEGDAATAQTTSKFKDAANTSVHWAAGYIAQGVSDGFIDGYDDTTFGPDDRVTYAQACKMLVAAIGYTIYAENAGGWPSGYVSQASSLNIGKGVSAGNDTQLTRDECASMVYNTMKAPLCEVSGYTPVASLSGGYVQAPRILVYDKDSGSFKSLLTDRHEAYYVKGRVIANSRSDSILAKNEVRYSVEVSDNFRDQEYTSSAADDRVERMNIGNTNADDMMFSYSEAIVRYDEDAGRYTILSIVGYGESKTVSFSADDVALDSAALIGNVSNGGKIEVYKSKATRSTAKYHLANSIRLYVNNRDTTVSAANIAAYIRDNKLGTVTLVDSTNSGTTATDGYYDYIMVSYYIDAVVASVQESSGQAKIYFNGSSDHSSRMGWDTDDEHVNVKFIKYDTEISYADLDENDILTIEANPDIDLRDISDDDYVVAYVSSDTVSVNVSSVDTDEETIEANGKEYELASDNLLSAADFGVGDEYVLYLDIFGYVAYRDEGATSKNYGVIIGMYTGTGESTPSVKLITSNGSVVSYVCKNNTEAGAFYRLLTTGTSAGTAMYPGGAITINTPAISALVMAGETVCSYKLVGGKIKTCTELAPNGGAGKYRESTSKLAGCTISDDMTSIIDISDYIASSTVGKLSLSSFKDDFTYTAYAYDRSTSSSTYRFVVVTDGMSSLRPSAKLAVVQKMAGTTMSSDDTLCKRMVVCINGKEEQTVLLDDEITTVPGEGDIIQYIVSSDGYVKSNGFKILLDADNSYSDMLVSTTNEMNFEDRLTAYARSLHGLDSEVNVYYGVVFRQTGNVLELLTARTGAGSSVNAMADVSTAGADRYTVDYMNKAKYRVSVGGTTQASSIFSQTYTDSTRNVISWSTVRTEQVSPAIAFVLEVDKDVTDVVYYTGEYRPSEVTIAPLTESFLTASVPTETPTPEPTPTPTPEPTPTPTPEPTPTPTPEPTPTPTPEPTPTPTPEPTPTPTPEPTPTPTPEPTPTPTPEPTPTPTPEPTPTPTPEPTPTPTPEPTPTPTPTATPDPFATPTPTPTPGTIYSTVKIPTGRGIFRAAWKAVEKTTNMSKLSLF